MDDTTRRVRKILNEYAPAEARRLGHEILGKEHILLGMLRADNFQFLKELVVGSIFSRLEVNVKKLAIEIKKRIETDSSRAKLSYTATGLVEVILEAARKEAQHFGHRVIGSEHVLMAILQDKSGIVSTTLAEFGVTYQVVREELRRRPDMQEISCPEYLSIKPPDKL